MDKKTFVPKKMVGWFDMKQLAQTAVKATLSSIFGSYADKRETIASISEFKYYDYSGSDTIWFDYISDVGDGFDSTFTMAHLLSRESLTVKTGKEHVSLPKGNLLVFGGDQVYPVATRENYEQRFKIPYELASPKNDFNQPEDIFAVPGNHDWYDGLTNFMKIFCQGRWIGNWRTVQNRSYFAIKLTQSTWLFGIDIQLDADIDMPQLQYFETVTGKFMQEGDHVILCSAKPSWALKAMHPGEHSYETLKYFETRFIEQKKFNLVLSLSGDLHHYAHYHNNSPVKPNSHKITSGGGGAFMQGTHNLPGELKDLREGDYTLKKTFPDKITSRVLVFNNYKFFIKNWSFGLFMGFIYLLYAWCLQMGSRVGGHNILTWFESTPLNDFWGLRRELTIAMLNSPSVMLLTSAVVLGLWKFCVKSAHDKRTGLLGIFHGLLHVVLIILLFWWLSYFNHHVLHLNLSGKIGALILEMFVVGGLVSSFFMGIYLMVANLGFHIHDKEAFSAMKIEDYKNFLRIKVTAKAVTVYAVGITKVARWRKSGEFYKTDNKLAPELIEDPIVINLEENGSLK